MVVAKKVFSPSKAISYLQAPSPHLSPTLSPLSGPGPGCSHSSGSSHPGCFDDRLSKEPEKIILSQLSVLARRQI